VWAVGVAAGGFPGTRGLIEHWNGTAWAQVPSPDPGLGGAHETDLFGVALASPTSVWAVGYHTGRRSRLRTLVEHWNGSTWTVVPTPNTNALDNELNAVVTVPGTGSVWAFGAHATPTGGSRQRVGRFNELASVAAIPGTSGLWAVGNLSTERVVIMRWTGDSWRKTPSPFLGGCPELDGVVAISRVNAWAVGSGSGCGSSTDPAGRRPRLWTAASDRLPRGAPGRVGCRTGAHEAGQWFGARSSSASPLIWMFRACGAGRSRGPAGPR
jgi:hypothetical protein